MRIYLRPITEKDGKLIVKWRNSKKVSSHCMTKKAVTEESNLEFYKHYVETGKYRQFIVERIEETSGVASYPIATVYLKDIDEENRRCEFCIFTSDDEEWNTESQAIAIRMLLDKVFEEYGMHKIYSYVFEEHLDEKALLEEAGFRQEAVLEKEAFNEDGKYSNIIRMSIFKTSED